MAQTEQKAKVREKKKRTMTAFDQAQKHRWEEESPRPSRGSTPMAMVFFMVMLIGTTTSAK